MNLSFGQKRVGRALWLLAICRPLRQLVQQLRLNIRFDIRIIVRPHRRLLLNELHHRSHGFCCRFTSLLHAPAHSVRPPQMSQGLLILLFFGEHEWLRLKIDVYYLIVMFYAIGRCFLKRVVLEDRGAESAHFLSVIALSVQPLKVASAGGVVGA